MYKGDGFSAMIYQWVIFLQAPLPLGLIVFNI